MLPSHKEVGCHFMRPRSGLTKKLEIEPNKEEDIKKILKEQTVISF